MLWSGYVAGVDGTSSNIWWKSKLMVGTQSRATQLSSPQHQIMFLVPSDRDSASTKLASQTDFWRVPRRGLHSMTLSLCRKISCGLYKRVYFGILLFESHLESIYL